MHTASVDVVLVIFCPKLHDVPWFYIVFVYFEIYMRSFSPIWQNHLVFCKSTKYLAIKYLVVLHPALYCRPRGTKYLHM